MFLRQIRPNVEELLCTLYEAEARAKMHCEGLAQVQERLAELEEMVNGMEKQIEKSERLKRRMIQLLEN